MRAKYSRNVSPAAERMRRTRRRRRDGLVYLGIELRVTEIEQLVETGYLKPGHRDNPMRVLHALYQFLDHKLG